MTQNAVPSVADVAGPAKDKLLQIRPTVAPHLEDGHWGDVLVAFEGQIEVSRTRLADEVAATRISAEGTALTELCRSEFDTVRLSAPTSAIGEAILNRQVVHFAPMSLPGFSAITLPDAIDASTAAVLMATFGSYLQAHALSVYSSALGTDSHRNSTSPSIPPLSFTIMSDYVSAANDLRDAYNLHLSNLIAHPNADAVNLVNVPDAFASDGTLPFASNTAAAQKSVLRVINALKRAYNAHTGVLAAPGTVKKGTKWIVAADPTGNPPIQGGTYISTVDVTVATGQQTVFVPVQASRSGSASNLAVWDNDHVPSVTLAGALFDSSASLKFTTTTLRAAGGSDGQQDDELRRAAKPRYTGRYGPTAGALAAGSLAPGNVVRFALLEDPNTGTAHAYVADPSWAQSSVLLEQIQQDLTDNWLGAGCRLSMGPVRNKVVRVEATISLKDAKYAADTSAITMDLQSALKSYFDDRPDWYTFKLSALRGVCSRANRKILSCNLVVVRDENGLPLAEPGTPTPGGYLTHYWFGDNALTSTYVVPT